MTPPASGARAARPWLRRCGHGLAHRARDRDRGRGGRAEDLSSSGSASHRGESGRCAGGHASAAAIARAWAAPSCSPGGGLGSRKPCWQPRAREPETRSQAARSDARGGGDESASRGRPVGRARPGRCLKVGAVSAGRLCAEKPRAGEAPRGPRRACEIAEVPVLGRAARPPMERHIDADRGRGPGGGVGQPETARGDGWRADLRRPRRYRVRPARGCRPDEMAARRRSVHEPVAPSTTGRRSPSATEDSGKPRRWRNARTSGAGC